MISILIWILVVLTWTAALVFYFHGLSFEHKGLWTQLKDGCFAEIVGGNGHKRFIIRHLKYWMDKDSSIRERAVQELKKGHQRFHLFDIPSLGMYWKGLPPFTGLKHNSFTTKTVKSVSHMADGIITLGETQDCPVGGINTPIVFIYAIQTGTIELRNKVRVGAITQTTLRFSNLYKAMYDTEQNGGFMSNVHTVEHGSQREIIAEMKDYDELVRQKSELNIAGGYADTFRTRIMSALEIYGVTCVDVDLVDHHPADTETAKATAAKQLAILNAEAVVAEERGKGEGESAKADGQAQAIRKRGRATADAAAMMIDFTGTARSLAAQDLLDRVGENTDVAIALINGEAVEKAFGEGPNGTRPDVVSFGSNGLNILADGRPEKKGKNKPQT